LDSDKNAQFLKKIGPNSTKITNMNTKLNIKKIIVTHDMILA